MADEAKIGTDWQNDELDAIVADYFVMLDAEIAGRPYVKAEHRRALMAHIRRTKGSVEFKHQNISAALDAIGLPWIPGYKPAVNYQGAIFDSIDRYLTQHPAILEAVPVAPLAAMPASTVFIDAPSLAAQTVPVPDRLRSLVRKSDPVERDYRNRFLGKAGESFVLDLERRLLAGAARPDLARKVRWVAAEDGDTRDLPARKERAAQVIAEIHGDLPGHIDDHDLERYHLGMVKDERRTRGAGGAPAMVRRLR